MSGKTQRVWLKPLQSHLFWFVSVGVLIFLIDGYLSDSRQQIVVDAAVVSRIAGLWEGQMQRPPTEQELENLVSDWIGEEILYREARRLRLDEDDLIVRRRLVQKINFIAEESTVTEPTHADLVAYFEANPDRYRLPVRFTFSQLFFRDEERANAAANNLVGADEGAISLADVSMTNQHFILRNEQEIQSALGRGFTDALLALEPEESWQGPIKSDFGWHYVWIAAKRAPELPDFEAAQQLVLNDYLHEKRSAARANYVEGLRQQFDVVFRLPE